MVNFINQYCHRDIIGYVYTKSVIIMGRLKQFGKKKRKKRSVKSMRQEYELIPRYDSRKSFYKKARVTVEGDKATLYSYGTDVAVINRRTNKATVPCTYSPTTLRHVKEFLKQHGLKAESKTQIEKDY